MKPILRLLILMFLITLANAATDIPEDSKESMDFRGKPNFTNPQYAKLYQCKTYEELKLQLPIAIKSIAPKKEGEWEDASQMNVVILCQLALIRVHYILDEIKEADKLLMKFHPAMKKE